MENLINFRWKFCVQYVNGNLGNAAGSMFVKKHFDEKSKEDVSKLLNELLKVLYMKNIL